MPTKQQILDAIKAALDTVKTQIIEAVNQSAKDETAKVVTLIEALPTAGNLTQADLDGITGQIKDLPGNISTALATAIGAIDTNASAQVAADAAAAAGAGSSGSTGGAPNPPPQPTV